MIQNILVPTDFSTCADAAVQYATELVRAFDARLQLLHVVSVPTLYGTGTEPGLITAFDLIGDLETGAQKMLEDQARHLSLPSDRVSVRATSGTAVNEILDTIRTDRIDLVVMGTHGRGMIEHFLLGSVAERVVRLSPVPVLTLHGPVAGPLMKPAAEVRSSAVV